MLAFEESLVFQLTMTNLINKNIIAFINNKYFGFYLIFTFHDLEST